VVATLRDNTSSWTCSGGIWYQRDNGGAVLRDNWAVGSWSRGPNQGFHWFTAG